MKKEIDNLVSKCCRSPIKIAGIGDFNDSDRVSTHYYECLRCGKPCDAIKVLQWEKELHIAMEEVRPADWYYEFIRREKQKSYEQGIRKIQRNLHKIIKKEGKYIKIKPAL